MKRIAIYCDGTWNRPDAQFPTNVYKLHRATRQTALDGTTQLPKYIPGVGTGFGMTGARKWLDRFRGGLFGTGVTRNIMVAYRFLAEFYEPGDEIYIFGFSRGAFTARSLAGLIRASGLPPNDQVHNVPLALRRYRDSATETRPGSEESHKFRLTFSPNVATSRNEVAWRTRNGHPEPALLSLTYVGVWDTVGAMGVPEYIRPAALLFNGRHRFHDTELSSSVMAARHAVSIDEQRKTYPPTLWTNFETLNRDNPERERFYRQNWMPGNHGSVGGGGDIVGLSNISLRWIAEGAAEQGLDFDWSELAALIEDEDHMAPLINKTRNPNIFVRLTQIGKLDRPSKYLIASWDLSETARNRHAEDTAYRPELF